MDDIYLIHQNKSILDALNKLNLNFSNSSLILFVYNDEKQIIGSITDGDIRRYLVKKQSLNELVKNICNKEFKYILDTSEYVNLEKFLKNGISILPVLNEDFTLNKILDLSKNNSILPIDCVIMAGGRGKRLSPLTDLNPKPMLKISDKPLLEHIIDYLIKFGIRRIFLSVNYLSDKIIKYFGDGKNKGIEIIYIHENNPLGTAGSLSLIKSKITNHLLLLNGDILTNVNLEKLYLSLIKSNSDMIISSKDYTVDIPYAVFDLKNDFVKRLSEKPKYQYMTNAGVYMFKKEIIDLIPINEFFNMTDLISLMLDKKLKIKHQKIDGFWIDIGNPKDYKSAQDLFKTF